MKEVTKVAINHLREVSSIAYMEDYSSEIKAQIKIANNLRAIGLILAEMLETTQQGGSNNDQTPPA